MAPGASRRRRCDPHRHATRQGFPRRASQRRAAYSIRSRFIIRIRPRAASPSSMRSSSGYFRRWESPGARPSCFTRMNPGMRAARGQWALEYAGHPKARMLDGGLKAAAGEKLATDVEKFAPSDFQLSPRAEILATYPHLLEQLGQSRRTNLRRSQRCGIFQRARPRETWRRDSGLVPSGLDGSACSRRNCEIARRAARAVRSARSQD